MRSVNSKEFRMIVGIVGVVIVYNLVKLRDAEKSGDDKVMGLNPWAIAGVAGLLFYFWK